MTWLGVFLQYRGKAWGLEMQGKAATRVGHRKHGSKQMTRQHAHTAPLDLKKTFLLQKYNNLTAIMQQPFDPLSTAC